MKCGYLDESGEFSFGEDSIYKHGLITVIVCDQNKKRDLKTAINRENGKAINSGWVKANEFKATTVFNNKKFGEKTLHSVLDHLILVPSLEIHFIIVNKSKITQEAFKNAPYGIAYNFFSGKILEEIIFGKQNYQFDLIFDDRNKETHSNKRFTEYLNSCILGKALEKGKDIEYQAKADNSLNFGLKAVDFICWSIFRKFESNDDRYYKKIEPFIKTALEWYA